MKYYPDHFWLMFDEDRLVAFVPYYAKFGFVNEGQSEKSKHGGVEWNQMRLSFLT